MALLGPVKVFGDPRGRDLCDLKAHSPRDLGTSILKQGHCWGPFLLLKFVPPGNESAVEHLVVLNRTYFIYLFFS